MNGNPSSDELERWLNEGKKAGLSLAHLVQLDTGQAVAPASFDGLDEWTLDTLKRLQILSPEHLSLISLADLWHYLGCRKTTREAFPSLLRWMGARRHRLRDFDPAGLVFYSAREVRQKCPEISARAAEFIATAGMVPGIAERLTDSDITEADQAGIKLLQAIRKFCEEAS